MKAFFVKLFSFFKNYKIKINQLVHNDIFSFDEPNNKQEQYQLMEIEQ